ncbi:DUF4442 domain-containing protein [Cellvibrio zantedeschiae]|uniref:DUF4442 domain-containing protein n=1 Tax=Cellvibrio zantedeschiae TaxID=1237077 RepID=A0ABQ3AMZ2_9GAMM|nr:hotdog fold domain-containing protein [Cellvibrio zantedeschiae]GGY61392.1 DUF4442 domain-containing protein [Cellvibrio zantedeschiae]
MARETLVMRMWRKLNGSALGRWLFAKMVCFKAPYFASVAPRIQVLEPGFCEGSIRQHRAIQNHIGTVHAIALCNLAELCAGLMTDVSIPADMRWIPKSMKVNYLHKAKGNIRAQARPEAELYSSAQAYNALVRVRMMDDQQTEVFSAEIEMWISPRS